MSIGGQAYAALMLARRGFRVFPLGVKDWRPALTGWKDWATTDETKISEKWGEADYNIGVACGNGLLVVDVDDKPGKEGSKSLQEIGLDLSDYDTFTVRTPSGGRHLYYEAADYNNSAGRLGRDLDIRSVGGYVVGPGSVLDDGAKNAKGGVYVIETDAGIIPVPEPVTGRLHRPAREETVGAIELDTDAAIERATEYLSRAPLAIEGQGGDATTYAVAAKVKDFGVSRQVAFDLLDAYWNDRCSPPWSDAELVTKIENAYEYGQRPAGIDHPIHSVEGVHVVSPPDPDDWFDHGHEWRGSVSWLYYETLPMRGVCILTAPSGAGKTFVTVDLAHSLATERSWFGVTPEARGGTLMLVGEAFGSLKQRLAAITAAQGETDRPLPISARYVGTLAARGAWEELCRLVTTKAARMERDHGVPVRMIVLDTLSASGILDDENDNAQAATVMKMFAELSIALNVLFVVVHHPPKSGHGERGAGAIRNNADYVMEIIREGQSQVREIAMDKSRDGEQKVLGSFTLIPVEIGRDDKDRPIKTMVVSQGMATAGAAPFISRKAKAGEQHAELFSECLGESLEADHTLIDGVPMVEDADVKALFTERYKGTRDRTTIGRNFKAAQLFYEELGTLNVQHLAGRVYLAPKVFE